MQVNIPYMEHLGLNGEYLCFIQFHLRTPDFFIKLSPVFSWSNDERDGVVLVIQSCDTNKAS